MGGHSLEHHGGCRFRIDPLRNFDEPPGRDHREFGIGAGSPRVRHQVPDGHLRYPRPGFLDDTIPAPSLPGVNGSGTG